MMANGDGGQTLSGETSESNAGQLMGKHTDPQDSEECDVP